MKYLESLNKALHKLMHEDSKVILIGEDLLDPYGGAFKVSKNLSTAFPKQVLSTPISEQAIMGAGVGMAMNGMHPIVEIMFGDFITLCADQIVNHAAKYHFMYNEQVNVPVVVRTPMGGGRGYGPTHSQSLESMFFSIPNITIIAPSLYHEPGELLYRIVKNTKHPVIFIENKSSYPEQLIDESLLTAQTIRVINREEYGTCMVSIDIDEIPNVTIVTYGGVAKMVVEAAKEIFFEEEIIVDVIIPSKIKPIPINDICSMIRNERKILIIEEGQLYAGWGAELECQLYERYFNNVSQPIVRLGAKEIPIPSAPNLERIALPQISDIKAAIRGVFYE